MVPETNLPPWMKNKTGFSSFVNMDGVHILSAKQSSLKVRLVAVVYMRSNVDDLLGNVGSGGAGLKGHALEEMLGQISVM